MDSILQGTCRRDTKIRFDLRTRVCVSKNHPKHLQNRPDKHHGKGDEENLDGYFDGRTCHCAIGIAPTDTLRQEKTTNSTMQSNRLTFETHGNPADVLKLESFNLPAIADGEVLLKIHASPLNPADLNYIEGTYGVKPSLPAIAGIECFGTVIQSRTGKFPEGDSVITTGKADGWATHSITNGDQLITVPNGIDPLQAAMLKVNPATAWLLLHHFSDLKKGDWVTLNASNSGVGQCVIQLAASMGIRTVCFLRNESLSEELSSLGASHVFLDSPEGFSEARETIGKERAKLAFNAVGGDSALRLMKLLGESGTHITYGAMGRKPLTVPNGPLIFNDIRVRGLWVTKWMEKASTKELENTYLPLADRLLDGSLSQKVDSTFALADFRQALARLDESGRNGKVLFENP